MVIFPDDNAFENSGNNRSKLCHWCWRDVSTINVTHFGGRLSCYANSTTAEQTNGKTRQILH